MKKMLLISMMLAAAIFVLAACGSNSNSNTNNSSSSNVEDTGTAASAKVTIKAKRFEFDKPVYNIKKGEPTEITVVSEDGVHGVEIPDFDDLKLVSGKAKVVTFNDAGTYEFHCDIPCGNGHGKMVAKIVVE
ncbi:cytochrome C oxidase subunit II [Paenibacillus rhizovicinus]|uniref:Cytochrome C oxidase subunit II n=1 Tax=Paenibacillus rhizovicinus TaxID=2704463 RepID=A0A6C0P9Z2_9BACL|nr:cupredoxin domain-containing protein [Paenibacillus rhizovicinus]QHW33342.1 cytochrome C oxidase subunit II [Paenibacillus rhizovicinus]